MSKKRVIILAGFILVAVAILGRIIIYKKTEYKEKSKEEAIRGYNEFIVGERSIGGVSMEYIYTPTNEPDKRYATDYVIYDIDRDGIPELHVQTWRDYYIFSYKKDEFYILQGYFSHAADYCFTDEGVFVYLETSGIERRDFWKCFRLDSEGNEIEAIWFYRIEKNENNYYDEDDIYVFGGDECTMEEWMEKTRKYLYTDENGWEHIRNKVEWTVFCEEEW